MYDDTLKKRGQRGGVRRSSNLKLAVILCAFAMILSAVAIIPAGESDAEDEIYVSTWDELKDELKESVLKIAQEGRLSNLTVDDCKPGGTVPIFDPERLVIMVAGPLQGQSVGMVSMGSYGSIQAPVPFKEPLRRPFFIKKITGATLTKAGK